MSSNTMIALRGTQKLTVSTTSVALTVPTGAKRASIYVSGDVWMGLTTAATASSALVVSGSVIDLTDAQYELSQFAFLRQTATDATLTIMYFN